MSTEPSTTPQQSVRSLGQATYAAFGHATNHLNSEGDRIPAWEQLGDRLQRAWKAAGRAARQVVFPRDTVADEMACGTCRRAVAAGEKVEHSECAARAQLLPAPDMPDFEDLADLTDDEKAELPARFHIPVWIEDVTPQAWVCQVCWGDGWTSGWPCATATKHGGKVFTR
jgi:hypothetical protein